MNPILPIFEEILFPGCLSELMIHNSLAVGAIEYHLHTQEDILVTPMLRKEEFPSPTDFFSFGCQAKILRSLSIDTHSRKILIEGVARIKVTDLSLDPEIGYTGTPNFLDDHIVSEEDTEFWMEKLKSSFTLLYQKDRNLHPEIHPILSVPRSHDHLIFACAQQLKLRREQRLMLLASQNQLERVQLLLHHIAQESDFQEINNRAIENVHLNIEKQNRSYFIKKHMQSLQDELPDQANTILNRDLTKIQERMQASPPPQDIQTEIDVEMQRLSQMSIDSSEYNIGLNWLTVLSKLPWQQENLKEIDINFAEKVLNSDHYGLEEIKERILEQLAVQKRLGRNMGTILCFVGPPGVGKTSLAQSIAKSLSRPFQRISLGGIKDEAEIRGHRRTYIGAMPGRFIRSILKAQSKRPVLLLDEIDKIGRDVRGDPSSALLEILDPEQNHAFVDHYIDQPFDLSQVLFICTANTLDSIDPALLDRLEVLELYSYTREEKEQIVTRHLIPKIAAEHAIGTIAINPQLISFLIEGYTREAGLRKLSQILAKIARKTALSIIREEKTDIQTRDDIRQRLGPELPPPSPITDLSIGQSLGLAWTPICGSVLRIQAFVSIENTEKLTITGNLGTVMKESIAVAYTYIQIKHSKNNPSPLHIHVPEGAISKDGPSAGLAIAIAIYSALNHKKPLSGIAMTGEIDLAGYVSAIGGLKEKILAAYHRGIHTIILPKENAHEVVKIPPSIRERMVIRCVSSFEEAQQICFAGSDDVS